MPSSFTLSGAARGNLSCARGPGRILPALGLAGSRGSAMVAQVAVQIAVGTLAGPVGLGVLQLFMAWSNVLGEVLARGWPSVTLKRVAIAWDGGDRPASRAAADRARRAVLRGCPAALLAGAGLIYAVREFLPSLAGLHAAWLLMALILAAFIFALMRLGSEALKGADAPLTAVTLENLSLPLTLLALCLACLLLDVTLTPALLVVGGALGLAVGAAWAALALHNRLGRAQPAALASEPAAERRERRALWFGSVQAIAFLQLPFLVLPLFAETATIGIYAVAHKLVNVITTLLILLASVFGPAFARAAAAGNRHELGRLLARSQWLSAIIFGPAAAVLLLANDGLAALFHVPSPDLLGFMAILVVGQSINAATGLSGVLLNLTGAARTEWRISLAALSIALLLAAPAGVSHGATGVAVLFSVVITLKNIASWLAARRHIACGVLAQ